LQRIQASRPTQDQTQKKISSENVVLHGVNSLVKLHIPAETFYVRVSQIWADYARSEAVLSVGSKR
jgi:hypothetical protein